jgi:O-acetyl-ADP-ribose deacetylase (regulator of RNase III)
VGWPIVPAGQGPCVKDRYRLGPRPIFAPAARRPGPSLTPACLGGSPGLQPSRVRHGFPCRTHRSSCMTIGYRHGDATAPGETDPTVIVHVCNDVGKWGKGFVLAISKRWSEPERVYRTAFAKRPFPQLGDVQFVPVTHNITVANLIGQHGVRSPHSKSPPPIRYPAIREGLKKVATFARKHGASVAMPRIGCGLAGGNWAEIERLLKKRSARSVFLLASTISHRGTMAARTGLASPRCGSNGQSACN